MKLNNICDEKTMPRTEYQSFMSAKIKELKKQYPDKKQKEIFKMAVDEYQKQKIK